MDKIIQQVDIARIKNKIKTLTRDSIIDEDILEIHINGEKTFQMVFSMTHTQALAAGFLFTQGIVREKADILDLIFVEETKQCRVTLGDSALKRLDEFKTMGSIRGSSGGALLQNPDRIPIPDRARNFSITYDQVSALIQLHGDHSELFHQTGAVHSAGLCDPFHILAYYEDIGRHNALDKLAGDILLREIPVGDKVATLSCRMSLEIIGKIIRTGIPVVISNAAPTLSAVRLADRAGVTVIGFARENRFNIYSHDQRIRPGIV
ncbi:MAG: formate dehydrogenase accessory sulfurtransferase FdhD [Desulfobacteraceae bacterium]|nr:formate dehydrogenase accessory sulfurtransferase FdhD [Desulfobacteraceae bacterium]